MEKKKRGRKPKNNIITNTNPVFDTNNDNLIICVKNIEKDLNINELNDNDTNNDNIIDNYYHINDIDKNEKLCWNCCDKISNLVSYPISYNNNIFHTNGDFCCYECAGRYIFDTYNNKEIWEKYYLLNFFYYKNTNNLKKIKIPSNKLRLKKFGGDLTKEEYINNNINISYDCYLPPTIPVNNLFYNNDNTHSITDNELKLYRKKNLNNKNIKSKFIED